MGHNLRKIQAAINKAELLEAYRFYCERYPDEMQECVIDESWGWRKIDRTLAPFARRIVTATTTPPATEPGDERSE